MSFAQQEGIGYEESFPPMKKWNTIKLVLTLAAENGCNIHQIDLKSVFLNGDLQEEIYMIQPLGFELEGQEHKILKITYDII